jgi:regulatory protein
MSEITKLEVQKNNSERISLYLDDKFYCGISAELVIKNHLKVGLNISKEELDELVLEDEKGKALSRAVKYIGNNLKTIKQIRDYLKKKDYNPNTIDYVIDKLKEYSYIDDEAYCKAFVSTYSHKYGKLKLISALKSKGVSDKTIDNVFNEDLQIKDSIESVANKYLKNKERNKETYLKLSRFLYSRGYEFDDINRLINILKEEE